MHKEANINTGAICLFALLILSNDGYFSRGDKQNSWISLIIAAAAALLISFLPAFVLTKHEKIIKNKIFSLISFLFAAYIFAVSLGKFTGFVRKTALDKTSEMLIALIILSLAAWAATRGPHTLGRAAIALFSLAAFVILFVCILQIPEMKIKNLTPVSFVGIDSLKNDILIFISDIFIFTFALLKMKNINKRYSIMWKGITAGSILVLILTISNILTLGGHEFSLLLYPTFSAVSVTETGSFLQRIEVFASVITVISVFVKLTLCIYAMTVTAGNLGRKHKSQITNHNAQIL